MKKVIVLLMAALMCLGMLAACGSSAGNSENPKHGEIATLLGEAKTEYDAVLAAIEEKGEEGLEDVKAEAEKVGVELTTIEKDIADSKLLEMAEEELDALKDKLGGWKGDLVAMKATIAAKVEKVASEAVSVVETDVIVPTEDEIKTLMKDSKAEYEEIMVMFETLEGEGIQEAKDMMASIKDLIDTMENEIVNSDIGQWADKEKTEAHEALQYLKDQLLTLKDALSGAGA